MVQASVVPFNAVPNALIITVNEFPEFAEILARWSLHKKRTAIRKIDCNFHCKNHAVTRWRLSGTGRGHLTAASVCVM
jgi:hypothetical protein